MTEPEQVPQPKSILPRAQRMSTNVNAFIAGKLKREHFIRLRVIIYWITVNDVPIGIIRLKRLDRYISYQ